MNQQTTGAFSRRSFLRRTLQATAASGIVLAGWAPLRAETHVPFEVKLHGDGWEAQGRKNIISQSLWVINRRFLDVQIIANGLAVDGNNYNQVGDLWRVTNLGAYKPQYGYADILLYQLAALREATQRPTLNIVLSDKPESNAVGWANTDLVRVKFKPETHTVEGEFKIHLNAQFLGGAGHHSDPYYWAGTIAHEMLHNLGHLHVADRESPQYDRCQLIAHERAVYYNGQYRRGLERPRVLCGGRWPG